MKANPIFVARSVVALAIAATCASVACGSSDGGDPGTGDGDAGAIDPKTPLGSTLTDSGSPTGDAGAGGGGDAGDTVPPGTCGTASPPTGFIAKVSVKVGSATRTYALTVPAGYKDTTLYPLVVGFHGDGGNGAQYRSSLGIEAQAGPLAIFAWPDGTNNNEGHSFDQAHDPPNNADVAFFDAIVDAVATTYCINKGRVFAHGMSGGAYFVNQLGRWRATKLRAIAPQSGGGPFGIANSDYDPSNGQLTVNGPVPALMIHGLSDNTVPISEGMKSLSYWRMADQSTSGQAATSPSPCEKQKGGTKTVTFCAIPGLDHAIWSGAPAAIWQFFAAN